MTPKLPGLLVRYIQQKRCVAFVGAGLSAGAGLPTWGRLLLKGIDELVVSMPEGEGHQDELRELVERGKLLEVADFCKEKLGAAYHQFLTDHVRGDQAELPRTHDVLMHLPFSAWVTTNYDKLLERAYSKVKGGFPKTLTHKDTDTLGRLLFDSGQFILKAHGDIDRPETVVLTSRDYSEIIHANPAFNEVFSGLLLTKALLFVGYSLSDPDFRLLMDRQLTHFKGFVPERYALMTGVGPVERDVLWRTARIQVISYENQSGKHDEVLHFLEALKAAVAPDPVAAGGSTKVSSPAQPGTQPPSVQVRSHMISSPQSAKPQSPGGWALEALSFTAPAPAAAPAPARVRVPPPGEAVPELVAKGPVGSPAVLEFLAGRDSALDDAAEELASSAAEDSPAPAAPVLQPGSTAPHQLFIESVAGKVQLRLVRGEAQPVVQGLAPTVLNEDVWLSLKTAVERSTKSNAWLYTHLTEKLFEEYLPREVLDALGVAGGASSQAPLVLYPSPGLARFPWELLPIQGEPVSLKRRLVRAPVGVPAQVRGVPQLRASPRVLLIAGEGASAAESASQIERLEKLYSATPGFSCKVLTGADATFSRVMAELDEALPDLLHYTGDIGQMDGELYLELWGDMELSAGALRSVLSRGRLPFLVMNAPSSAFAPFAFGVSPSKAGYQRLPVPPSRTAIFQGRKGFMDLATQMGVGAFVGAFDQPSAKAGTAFMVLLHRALLTGLPIVDAVRNAREHVRKEFPEDPTAFQYVLSGDGELQLWDSRRQDAHE